MNKDLIRINEEIEQLLKEPPNMYKYEKLGSLFVCKYYIEKALKPLSGTFCEVLQGKVEQFGEKETLYRLSQITSKHLEDLEFIAPTISGEFMKKVREM